MKKIAPFFIILAAILWSLDGVLRRSLYSIPTASLVMLEHMVGLTLLLPFLPFCFKEYQKMGKKEWGVMFFVAIFGGFLGTLCYTAALAQVNYISYTVVILLQQTQPIFAVILARLILAEKFNRSFVFLAILGLTATYFLSFPDYRPQFIGKTKEFSAALLALGAAVCWGTSTVFGKLILHKVNFIAVTTMRFILVIPTAAMASIILGENFSIATVSFTQWKYICAIALTAGAVSILLYYKGLKHTPAKISTFLELTYPASAMFIGFFFLKEGQKITSIQILSAIVLIFVIVALALTKKPEENHTN